MTTIMAMSITTMARTTRPMRLKATAPRLPTMVKPARMAVAASAAGVAVAAAAAVPNAPTVRKRMRPLKPHRLRRNRWLKKLPPSPSAAAARRPMTRR
jgi:hypothetical protein